MNVRDLIERLNDLDPEAEVLIASQPSWPMQNKLTGVASAEDVQAETACEDHETYNCPLCEVPPIIYLVEGSSPDQPYAPRAAWEVAR